MQFGNYNVLVVNSPTLAFANYPSPPSPQSPTLISACETIIAITFSKLAYITFILCDAVFIYQKIAITKEYLSFIRNSAFELELNYLAFYIIYFKYIKLNFSW